MKFSLPLYFALAAITLSLNACTTLANRRDLYQPAKVEGPYNDMLTKKRVEETDAKIPVPPRNH